MVDDALISAACLFLEGGMVSEWVDSLRRKLRILREIVFPGRVKPRFCEKPKCGFLRGDGLVCFVLQGLVVGFDGGSWERCCLGGGGGADRSVEARRLEAVPALPGQVHPPRHLPVDRDPRPGGHLRHARRVHPGVLHRLVWPGDLYTESHDRVPVPVGRSRVGSLGRADAADERVRRVQAVHPAAPGVQVLVIEYSSCSFWPIC